MTLKLTQQVNKFQVEVPKRYANSTLKKVILTLDYGLRYRNITSRNIAVYLCNFWNMSILIKYAEKQS